jgi:hypothetical protein
MSRKWPKTTLKAVLVSRNVRLAFLKCGRRPARQGSVAARLLILPLTKAITPQHGQ